MNNDYLDLLRAELRAGDPLCRYVTIERGQLELMLMQSGERMSQLAIAYELLQRARAELVRAWRDHEDGLQPHQETALRSIDECLACSRAAVRIYRHSVRQEFASALRNLLARTQSALREDARRERENKRKEIAETIEHMGEGLTIVLECLDSLLAQILAREELATPVKTEADHPSL